jgi:fatty-acyl-CoA synthase
LLIVVPSATTPATRAAVLSFLEGKIAKWWTPDDVVFVEALTYGATGKVQKMELRRRFAEHYSAKQIA